MSAVEREPDASAAGVWPSEAGLASDGRKPLRRNLRIRWLLWNGVPYHLLSPQSNCGAHAGDFGDSITTALCGALPACQQCRDASHQQTGTPAHHPLFAAGLMRTILIYSASAQVDLSGEWGQNIHKDAPERAHGLERHHVGYYAAPFRETRERLHSPDGPEPFSILLRYDCNEHE